MARHTTKPRLRLVTDGSGEKPDRVDRGIWRYPASGRFGVFVYRNGEQIFRMCDSLTEARELRTDLVRAGRRGIRSAARADQKITLAKFFNATYVPEAMRGNGLKESTIRSARSRFAQHLEPTLGDRRVEGLTYDDCMKVRAALVANDDISGQTRREAMILLRQLLEEAVMRGILLANPAALVKLPKRSREPVTVPEYDHAKQVIAAIEHPSARMVAEFLRQTGARLNEALALTWPCVLLAAKKVRIQQSIDQVTGTIITTKTSRVRIIDMPDTLVELLRAYREAQQQGDAHKHDPWVFPAVSAESEGRPMNDRNFQQRYWDVAVAKVGGPRFTPHGLRHLYASHLLQRGVEIAYVSKQLGHSSIYTTINTYAHFLQGSSTARRELDASFD
jgi:integrase